MIRDVEHPLRHITTLLTALIALGHGCAGSVPSGSPGDGPYQPDAIPISDQGDGGSWPDWDLDLPVGDGGIEVRTCGVLVVGDGVGAVAAAHEAASRGVQTCLVAGLDLLGGQITSQGVSALDEGGPQEQALEPFNQTYASFRAKVRQHYLSTYQVTNPSNEPQESDAFDPGSCWVSRLCFEPKVGAQVLEDLLQPLVTNGTLTIHRIHRPLAAIVSGATVDAVLTQETSGQIFRFDASVVIDATELGDLLRLAQIPYRTGAEATGEFNEPSAPASAIPECVQPFTFNFFVERLPSGVAATPVAKPPGYNPANYGLGSFPFDDTAGQVGFWTYRRSIDSSLYASGFANDIALINWLTTPAAGNSGGGNDFNRSCGPDGCNVIDKDPATVARIFKRGEEHALGLLYWLQHDVPRPDGSKGYPNLLLRTDITGTADGLTLFPYIREARRLKSLVTIREQDVLTVAAGGVGMTSRAALFPDSLGAGWYGLDLHPCAVGQPPQVSTATRPFQIPAGALVPAAPPDNFLAAAKNIGTTHLSNGCYRLHPVEWNIGLAAGEIAATSIAVGISARALVQDATQLRRLQHSHISQRGGKIYWFDDVDQTSGPLYVATQMLGVEGVIVGFDAHRDFLPASAVTRGQAAAIIAREFAIPLATGCNPSFSDVPCTHPFYPHVQGLADAGVVLGHGDGTYKPDDPATRAQYAVMLARAANATIPSVCTPPYADVPASLSTCSYVAAAKAQGFFVYDPGPSAQSFSPDAALTRQAAALMTYPHLAQRYGIALP
jgi:hypothetical protein